MKKFFIKFKSKKIVILGIYVIYAFLTLLLFYNNLSIKDETTKFDKVVYLGAFSVIFVIISVILFIIYKKKLKPELFFVIIASILGGIFIFVSPLLKAHDEYFHWYKSYAVSLGRFVPETSEGELIFDKLPENVETLTDNMGGFPNIKYSTLLKAFTKAEISKNDINKEILIENTPTAYYPFVQMLPQATGIFIARNLGFNIYVQALFGRIGNLILFIILGYFSIKLIPNKKYLLVALLLCPKILYISSSMSSDVFTNSIIIFFIAYILNLMHSKRHLKIIDYILLAIIMPCVSIAKIVYLPLCGLIFLIPKECFSKKYMKVIITITLFMFASVIGLAWLNISAGFLQTAGPNSSLQVEYILKNPFEYIAIVLRAIATNFSEWALDMVGGYMQWGRQLIQYSIISDFVYIVFLFSLFVDEEKFELTNKQKLWISIILIVTIVLILTALYVQWSSKGEIGGSEITGVQGRYFVPIFMLIPLILPNKLLNIKEKINYKYIYYSILLWQIPTLLNIIVKNL